MLLLCIVLVFAGIYAFRLLLASVALLGLFFLYHIFPLLYWMLMVLVVVGGLLYLATLREE